MKRNENQHSAIKQPKYSVQEVIRRREQGEMQQLLLFWGHTTTPGRVYKTCFSQWYPCTFTAEGETFCCTEQYMMAGKARLFGDEAVRAQIMASTDPMKIKKLGREVANFDAKVWDDNKYAIVLAGNVAKFGQNEPLKEYLLGTGDAAIAEASPYDDIWGIRLGIDDPKAQEPRQWQGQNLLGAVIMEVRDILREMQENE